MPLVLSEEQRQLQHTAAAFFDNNAPVSALRALRDEQSADGFSRALWQEMVTLGWPGAFLPECYGGIGCGYTELGVVAQASGTTLSASPLFSSVALCASALMLAGNEAQKLQFLPPLANGKQLFSLALEEGAHHRPTNIATTAVKKNSGYEINGCKLHVLDGHVADYFIVVARTAGNAGDESGISLFVVDAVLPGVSAIRRSMVDSRNMAEVRLENVSVAASDLLGPLHQGYGILCEVLDRGNAVLAAEMLGSVEAAFSRTLGFLKTREQFGVLIGTFQALQHRAAKMFGEIELSRSVVLQALQAIDSNADNTSLLVSLAKVQVASTFRLVSDESIQMFGGIGMTDAEDIGFYLKRARVAAQTLGDENYHLQRYARLRGY